MSAAQFALTAAAARGEVWRLWTGHLVHYDVAHLVTNAIAIAVPLALVDRRSRRTILLAMTLIAPAISIVLLAAAHFDEYRGASGLALAIWVASALSLLRAASPRDRKTGAALLVLAAAKLAAEMVGAGHVRDGIASLPLAHVAGSIAGAIAFACCSWGVGSGGWEEREATDGSSLPLPTPHSPPPTPHYLIQRSVPISIE